ncbi:MAG TPA: response regulator [Lacunisphaera sp.]|nr:response regulator [Lacunisphaera sp.]
MKHILVADDDPAIRRVLRLALEGLGYKVSEAADGKVAMERYIANKPDCVVTDLVMPNQEGIETIMQMRRNPHRAAIIAMSGYTGTRAGVYLNMARSLGADAILEKPFTVDQIKTAVEKVLGKAEGRT